MQQFYQKAQPSHFEQLVQIMNSIYPTSQPVREALAANVLSLELDKDVNLIAEGETCHYLYFIVKGALMGYTTHHNSKVFTYIAVENEFVTSVSGINGQAPSREGIMAVEPTSLIAVPNQLTYALLQEHFDYNYIWRTVLQWYYTDVHRRLYVIRVGNAEDRYQYFVQTNPGFIDRIPVEYIASLLDMKPVTLDRIRKKHQQSAQDDWQALSLQLDQYMQTHQPYRNKTLTLAQLAKALGITAHKLSSLLNKHYQLNFTNYINTCRINSITKQMRLPQHLQHFTIEAIAQEAGFSSRSVFYNAFKKVTGFSPAGFARQQQP